MLTVLPPRLPWLQPNPTWKEQVKQRLLEAYERCYNRLSALRHWAIYVSSDAPAEGSSVADAIVARGPHWRPVAVRPERMLTAVSAIHPALVVVDSRLPDIRQMVEEVHHCSAVTVVTDRELIAQSAA
ncbi:MAG TPA: hypothetical protein VKU60_19345 [Chloroflexota bacterium]|nr:hypothetical protein [Chloroflexota bacterium]